MCDYNDSFYRVSNNYQIVNNRLAPTQCRRLARYCPSHNSNDHEWIFDLPNTYNAQLLINNRYDWNPYYSNSMYRPLRNWRNWY
jgi:hypothetical protein